MAELVDALDSKSSSARSAGSIPARGTTLRSSSFGWQATRSSLDEGVSSEALAKEDCCRFDSAPVRRTIPCSGTGLRLPVHGAGQASTRSAAKPDVASLVRGRDAYRMLPVWPCEYLP